MSIAEQITRDFHFVNSSCFSATVLHILLPGEAITQDRKDISSYKSQPRWLQSQVCCLRTFEICTSDSKQHQGRVKFQSWK